MSADFSIEQLQGCLELFARELLVFGIDVQQRRLDRTLQLHWTDVGLDDFFSVAGQCLVALAASLGEPGIKFLIESRDLHRT